MVRLMEEREPNCIAYEAAVGMLMAGQMPVCVPFEDSLHVIAVRATSRETLSLMINPNERLRTKLAISITKAIHAEHRQEEEVGT